MMKLVGQNKDWRLSVKLLYLSSILNTAGYHLLIHVHVHHGQKLEFHPDPFNHTLFLVKPVRIIKSSGLGCSTSTADRRESHKAPRIYGFPFSAQTIHHRIVGPFQGV